MGNDLVYWNLYMVFQVLIIMIITIRWFGKHRLHIISLFRQHYLSRFVMLRFTFIFPSRHYTFLLSHIIFVGWRWWWWWLTIFVGWPWWWWWWWWLTIFVAWRRWWWWTIFIAWRRRWWWWTIFVGRPWWWWWWWWTMFGAWRWWWWWLAITRVMRWFVFFRWAWWHVGCLKQIYEIITIIVIITKNYIYFFSPWTYCSTIRRWDTFG